MTALNRFFLCCLMLSVTAVWGWTFVVVKDAIAGCDVMQFLAVRFLIGTVAVWAFSFRRVTRRSLMTGGSIGLVLAMSYALQTFGLDNTTATNTGLITGLFIAFAPPANRLLFGVRTSPVQWAVIAGSVAGLALLTGSSPNGIVTGDVLTLGAAACFGLHIALLDRYAKGHSARGLAVGQLTGATLVFLAIWLARGPIECPPREAWFALVLTGVVATAVAFFVQTYVQQRLSAVATALIIVTEPMFAVVFGYLLAGDRLTALQFAGGGVMVAAMIAGEVYPVLNARRN